MKKLIPLIFILASCSAAIPQNDYVSINIWVYENIEYSYVNGDEYQSARETLELGTGDCEDFARLFLWMVHELYGVRGEMIMYYIKERDGYHMIARIDGVYYDPTWGVHYTEEPPDITYEWTYAQSTVIVWIMEQDEK